MSVQRLSAESRTGADGVMEMIPTYSDRRCVAVAKDYGKYKDAESASASVAGPSSIRICAVATA